ncbi:uncharacterized protein LOC111129941 [Crassostrea virginica]
MQESSKGNSQENVDAESPSAFAVCSKDGKIKRPNSGKRDSGYATDNSPANLVPGHGQLLFNFDDIPNRSLDDPSSLENSGAFNSTGDQEAGDTSDQEVEMVLSNPSSPGLGPSIPVPMRPSAPFPSATGGEMELDLIQGIKSDSDSCPCISSPSLYRIRSRRTGYYFRPIVNRSVGTQTPNPVSQILCDAIERFHPYGHVRDSLTRNRHNSAGDQNPSTSSPLPDIIPTSRDRSVSLPDVPSLRQQQEQAVGRELRRISDEFHDAIITRQRRPSIFGGPQSFPGSARFNMANIWDSLRNFITSPVTVRHDDGDDNADDDDDDDEVFPAKC